MPRPFTGKTHTGIRRVVRPNGDVYVYQRVTQYDPETRKTKTIKSTSESLIRKQGKRVRRAANPKKRSCSCRERPYRYDRYSRMGRSSDRHLRASAQ